MAKRSRARRGRHEGGCYQRSSDGLWVASKSCGTDPQTGRRLRMYAYGVTKTEAIERLDELKRQVTSGTLPNARQLTVADLLDRWLLNLQGRCGARTVEERRKVVNKHLLPRVGRVKLEALNPLHVETLFAQMRSDGVKPGAVQSAAKHLGTALNFATKLRLVTHSPAAGVAKPRGVKREMTILDPDQARTVAAAAAAVGSGPGGALVVAALYSGCRQSELLALDWRDVDLKAGTLSVNKALSRPKGKFVIVPPKSAAGRRVITLPPFAVAVLTAHKAAALKGGQLGRPVFCTTSGGYQHPGNVRRALARLVARLNRRLDPDGPAKPLPPGVRFHDLRHTHASMLISAGHSLRAVSARLGHRDPSLTLRIYAHVMPTDDAALAAGVAAILG